MLLSKKQKFLFFINLYVGYAFFSFLQILFFVGSLGQVNLFKKDFSFKKSKKEYLKIKINKQRCEKIKLLLDMIWRKEDISIIEAYLNDSGIKNYINFKGFHNQTILMTLCGSSIKIEEDVFDLLCAYGANPSYRHMNKKTPLMEFCDNRNVYYESIPDCLLKNINQTDRFGRNALFDAAMVGNPNIIFSLFKNGIDSKKRDILTYTAEEHLFQSPEKHIVFKNVVEKMILETNVRVKNKTIKRSIL